MKITIIEYIIIQGNNQGSSIKDITYKEKKGFAGVEIYLK